METASVRYEIVGGPGKYELQTGLFYGNAGGRLWETFCLRSSATDGQTVRGRTQAFRLNGVTRVGGTGEEWDITGEIYNTFRNKTEANFRGRYNTESHTGWIETDTEFF